MLLLFALLAVPASFAHAQDQTPPPAAAQSAANGAGTAPMRQPPEFSDYEEYLEWKKTRLPADEPSVTSVMLEGFAREDHAELTATIDVQINVDDAWVPVPLRMTEATLRAPPTYAGPGETVPDNGSVER